jgi:hypothetical protein
VIERKPVLSVTNGDVALSGGMTREEFDVVLAVIEEHGKSWPEGCWSGTPAPVSRSNPAAASGWRRGANGAG